MLSVIMLSVTIKSIMLSVTIKSNMLSVVMLNIVMAPHLSPLKTLGKDNL
jgi:hypothetical protein